MIPTTGYSISFPVFTTTKTAEGAYLQHGDVLGSAFSLGSVYMLTAGHVADAVGHDQTMVVGLTSPDGFFKSAVVSQVERLGADIALLRVEFIAPGSDSWVNPITWQEKPIEPFEIVRAMGYAYGLQVVGSQRSVVIRAFQGHVVSRLKAFLPVGWSSAPFEVYEVSFAAPRGLSGAPLLTSAGHVMVHGIVIGNSESRMLVFRSEERVSEFNSMTSVEQYEALSLGIAVQASAVLNQRSELLGATIREHLAKHSLLASS
jgi:hypothetical protein